MGRHTVTQCKHRCYCYDVLNGDMSLQDESRTLSSNYEQQLSVMSDHVCSLNEQLLRRTENTHHAPQLGGVSSEGKTAKVGGGVMLLVLTNPSVFVDRGLSLLHPTASEEEQAVISIYFPKSLLRTSMVHMRVAVYTFVFRSN